MCYALLGAVLLSILCFNARVTGEMVRVPLWNGMFSFVTPKGWSVGMADNMLTTHASPEPGSFSRILFTTPNPFYTGNASEFLAAQLAIFIDNTGGVVDRIDDDAAMIDGFDSHGCTFAMQVGGGEYLGVAFAFDFSGCKVFALALAPEDEFELYQDVFTEIICSYETDDAKLAAFQERLLTMSDEASSEAVGIG